MVDEDTLVLCFYAVFSEELSPKEVVVYLHALIVDEDTLQGSVFLRCFFEKVQS